MKITITSRDLTIKDTPYVTLEAESYDETLQIDAWSKDLANFDVFPGIQRGVISIPIITPYNSPEIAL